VVGRVTVTGNLTSDPDRIVRTFEMPTGMKYSRDAVGRGIRKLIALGLFDDAWVERSQVHNGVVDLLIHVAERPRIGKIEFTGNRKKETSDLEKKLILHPGEVYSPTAVQTQIDSLLRYYHEEGYARAEIHAETDTSGVKHQMVLRFVVAEGEKVKITRIVLQGAQALREDKGRKQLKTRKHGLFGGGEVKEDEEFPENKERLEAYYRARGYRDMRVVTQEVVPGATPQRLTLRIVVEEGIRYRMGKVTWTGNAVLSTAELQHLWPAKPVVWYDASKIEKTQGDAFAAYAEKGYLTIGVEPVESVHDSNVVDVQFHVAEGKPSNIRLVSITGNKNTREKVIRRELEFHEGDRFRRSSVARSRDDLMRLGLFEDVMPDLAAAESSDVDVVLKVKEKQVGTASAGAGYTAQNGLTGFIELSHNNVLGNGQSLALHLERGSTSNNYSLSFTEPWFHDSPTLLGFSLYNTLTNQTIYREKHVGGSTQIGRPLPWPDFSRGSISYRLEDITIDHVDTAAVAASGVATSQVLQGFHEGIATRTSAVDLNYVRNSTDNAFYPTRGSRQSISTELAGGPFGGQVNFLKHRLEGRWYFRSVLKGVTTMVRARWGVLGHYPDQHEGVPIYERFRLGGGSTPDPLRGYDDYQVVPDEFDYTVTSRVLSRIDSTTTPGTRDSIFANVISRVRYPGGRIMSLYTVEQQFPIVLPLRGVVFFDAGNTWDQWRDIQPAHLKLGAGIGFRLEIPLLGNVGFDLGYGFNRDDGPRLKGSFLLGNVNF
jgi:outer membrane protein insertion porin family